MLSTKAAETSIIKGNNYRISILTDRLIRFEYSKKNIFVDEETAAVTNRNFPKAKFDVLDSEDKLVIVTDYLRVIYDQQERLIILTEQQSLERELCQGRCGLWWMTAVQCL